MRRLIIAMLLLGTISTNAQTASNKNCFEKDLTQAVLWQQKSGEYRALCFQAYSLAKIRLDAYFTKMKRATKPPCIIVDIDETVLDNSPQSGYQVANCKPYSSADWEQWSKLSQADTVPGSCSFLKYAAMRKVVVYYITNRKDNELENTIKNLQKYGFPYADADHVIPARKKADGKYDNNKEVRRNEVREKYDIVLLCGDNLGDFSDVFYDKTEAERYKAVEDNSQNFGDKFIVLPNPMYGDWESAMFKGMDIKQEEKPMKKREMIKSYQPAK